MLSSMWCRSGSGRLQGSIRFSDRDGNPVEGIKVTLDPE